MLNNFTNLYSYGQQAANNPSQYSSQLQNLGGYGLGGQPNSGIGNSAFLNQSSSDIASGFQDPTKIPQFGGGSDDGSGLFGGDAWAKMFGGVDGDGNQIGGAAPVLATLGQSIMGAYSGMKRYGQAQDQLKEAKRQFDANYEAQRKSINTSMEDRQRARVASNPDGYRSVSEYMKKNRV